MRIGGMVIEVLRGGRRRFPSADHAGLNPAERSSSNEYSRSFRMSLGTGKLKQEVSSWPGISVHPHRFAAREYRFGKAEVGHVHFWGDVDIPLPRSVRDFLLAQNLAEQHRWVPDSGWTTFRIRGDKDIEHAIWLMRLSYLRYALKFEAGPFRFLEV
jgi:hypothetical protein